ncbi:MAG: anaerobic ribonucleoside-triphosphate reductase, partial [Oscillospiraceae bacterium]|nr:anaerobic ribonucleoside-triphosphate reductase [Oscillospiraceae bacterium]
MFKTIVKRDGREVEYNIEKIASAIEKAMKAAGRNNPEECLRLAGVVETKLGDSFQAGSPNVEDIQDTVETVLMDNGYAFVAKKYILYRSDRTRRREMNSHLMKIYDELTFADAGDSDKKRENANIDGDTAMGVMLKYGSEGAKDYYSKYILSRKQAEAHREGDIHIHDLDFYTLTTTCCQIDLNKLFKGGFS